MGRGAKVGLGLAMLGIGAAFILVPMFVLGEKPGNWLIWTGGAFGVVGASLAAPVQMKEVAETAQETVPFLGGGDSDG